MSLRLDATEEDFVTSMALHPRDISEEQLRTFEGYIAKIFRAFGMDIADSGHRPHPATLHSCAAGRH